MQRSDEGGSMLIEILVVLLLISVLAAVVLPSGFAFYRRAAVEYEALRLIGELRRMQAVSRTTARPLYILGPMRGGERAPALYVHTDGYEIRRPVKGRVRVYHALPLVRMRREGSTDRPAAFDWNGGIAWDKSSNMTIRVYAEGHEAEGLRVVIDGAARIRLQRGRP